MGIGTSQGAFYDDAFHYAAAGWDDKYDDNKSVLNKAVDEAMSGMSNGADDPHMVVTPLEVNKGEDVDPNIMDPKIMQGNKMVVSDPKNIYDESGSIVDYDNTVPADQQNIIDLMTKEPNYETPLSKDEESKFQEWKKKNAPNDSGADYDLRGAFKDNLTPAENGHWPDTYKKPNHPTFSDQSQYAKERPDLAGKWDGDKYIPPGY